MKEWDLARKEQEGQLVRREEEAKVREDGLTSREGTVEALEARAKEMTAAEQSHPGAVESFRALQAASEDEREKDVLAQVDLECRQLLEAAAVHAFSQILRIDATFNLDKLLDKVPADVADDLAKRVKKDAEAFAETFGPRKVDADGRSIEPAEVPVVEKTDGGDGSGPAGVAA